ncbi:hypothetical protein [Fonticella tunisiensis]|uniref:Tetratricopeptide repeat protein n=1 Tax=Fonticella tunisiensis TaxID=1096341 RepID=A0A4R7KQJ3_9CLOT|nr:hypothetical protein [Fonticella tunisiensis]TDT58424.1 hypothetical protein EDD71_11172 [Fonticella tunisiensis]
MLGYHSVKDLEEKVAPSILDMYRRDYRNFNLASIIAGFHRAYGLRDEGNSISIEIINSIRDYTEDLKDRNLLIWNLYVLSRELIDDGLYDEAISVIERAERNWSRDVILGDEIGVYHISWVEQLWLRKAEVYLILNDEERFEEITDRILMSRLNFFKEAENVTGETIFQDRCTYSCFELMAFQRRKKDIKSAISMIKQAILHKKVPSLNNEYMKSAAEKEAKGLHGNALDIYFKYYYKIPDVPFDNLKYGYCKSCIHFDGCSSCKLRCVETDRYKACTKYQH